MKDKISVLVAARKDSKYLSKFLFGILNNTVDLDNIEIIIMFNANDTWNLDLIAFFNEYCRKIRKPGIITWVAEDLGLGRAGLHEYFNELYKHATGQWIVYFCEDHYISMYGWDIYLLNIIEGNTEQNPERLNPHHIWCIVPKFDNAGAMNHILSRGYCEALGSLIGRHGWIDSYINEINRNVFGKRGNRIIKPDADLFHDFTHDDPSPFADAKKQSQTTAAGKKLPKFTDPLVRDLIEEDTNKIKHAIRGGL